MIERALLSFAVPDDGPTFTAAHPGPPGGANPEFLIPALADYVTACQSADAEVTVETYLAFAAGHRDLFLPVEPVDFGDRRPDLATPQFHHLYTITPTWATAWEGPESLLHFVAHSYDPACGAFVCRAVGHRPADLYREAARLLDERADARAAYLQPHFGAAADTVEEVTETRERAEQFASLARDQG